MSNGSDASQGSWTFTERALRWGIFLGASGFVVYLCLRILSPFMDVIAWASILAITFHPLHVYLTRKTGHRALSAAIASALVVVAFLIPLLFVAGLAINELLAIGQSLQETFTDDRGTDTTTPWGQAYSWLSGRLGFDAAEVVTWVRQHASELTAVVARYTVDVAASVTGAVMSFIFIIFAMFLLFRDGDTIVGKIPDLLPFARARSEALLLRISDVIHGSVYGVVVIALIQGALCGGMFWALGVPSAALWGMVTVLTSVLPLVGAAAVWVPGTLYLAVSGEWPRAIALLIWGTVVISGVDNFLRPRLVGGRVGLNELVMFFALLGGLQAFGVLGIVLGPLLFAIAASIVDVLTERTPLAVVATDGTRPADSPGEPNA
jgi:predicted PurR-regulated permease PerM